HQPDAAQREAERRGEDFLRRDGEHRRALRSAAAGSVPAGDEECDARRGGEAAPGGWGDVSGADRGASGAPTGPGDSLVGAVLAAPAGSDDAGEVGWRASGRREWARGGGEEARGQPSHGG